MRREGRWHGSNVRVNKKDLGHGDKAPHKPTNHSKVSGRCPKNVVSCQVCSMGLPAKKSIGKAKTALKARDLDVTRNYKMADWRLGEKLHWCADGALSCSEMSEEPLNRSGYGEDGDWEQQQGMQLGTLQGTTLTARSSEMVLPIECLVRRIRIRKTSASKTLPEFVTEGSNEIESDSDDESWSGVDLDFSDIEETSDDWIVVTELL